MRRLTVKLSDLLCIGCSPALKPKPAHLFGRQPSILKEGPRVPARLLISLAAMRDCVSFESISQVDIAVVRAELLPSLAGLHMPLLLLHLRRQHARALPELSQCPWGLELGRKLTQ